MTEHTGYLSESDLQAIQHLHQRAPYAITGISTSMFSVARHYGGMRYQDCNYRYIAEHDECVRVDVWLAVEKLHKAEVRMRRKKAAQARRAEAERVAALQGELV